MATPQSWIRLSLISSMLLSWYLPCLILASPLPSIQLDDDENTPSCSLRRAFTEPSYFMKQHIRTLSKQASNSDQDTVNRLFGGHLFFSIKENDRCYLMKHVLDFMVDEVLLHNSEGNYPNIQKVTEFLQHIQWELTDCNSDQQPQIQNNIEELRKTVQELGESGHNKAIGELNLVFQHLKDACTRKAKGALIRKTRN